ncbi:hypothetical protein [Streptomyces sp. 5-10]|uniref:hypothetical protein n=1 Tax=Streptomyces sp. 5-10 TaxID=878925 RepID=UPI00168A48C6|nr:hypothetical protein [Streptomyces sp. 5-10]MBD3004852.1 hypothetical protein [Streptomyces sp. 5-10]
MDTGDTDVSAVPAETPRGLKGKLAGLKLKRDKVKTKTSDVSTKVNAAYTKTAPTRKKINQVKTFIDPRNGQKWSFSWAVFGSWVIGPQTVIAAYERATGNPNPSDWGVWYGPGRWMRDTIKFAWENGHMTALFAGALLGLLPMLVMSAPERALSTKQMAWLICGGLGVYFTGSAQAYHVWPALQVWQLYLAALTALAYYCGLIAYKRMKKAEAALKEARENGVSEEEISRMSNGSGPVQMLLLMPAASIFSVVLYSPGAAF